VRNQSVISVIAVALLAASSGELQGQDRPIPFAPGSDAHTVAETPTWQSPDVIAFATVGLSVVGLALNTSTAPPSRLRGGVGIVGGALAVTAGVVMAAGENHVMGYAVGGLGALTIYYSSATLRRVERQRVSLAPTVSLGRQPTVGLAVSLSF
jgi:hypothetical protein